MHYFTVVLINFFVLDDKDEAESEAVLNALENIDDDCDRFVLYIPFCKVLYTIILIDPITNH